jgi:hypothetical protein
MQNKIQKSLIFLGYLHFILLCVLCALSGESFIFYA